MDRKFLYHANELDCKIDELKDEISALKRFKYNPLNRLYRYGLTTDYGEYRDSIGLTKEDCDVLISHRKQKLEELEKEFEELSLKL